MDARKSPKDGGPPCICPPGVTMANCPQCGDPAALTAAARPPLAVTHAQIGGSAFAAEINGNTVREQQQEIARLRAALSRITHSDRMISHEIAREALAQ